jgi:hypothetical protein
MRGLVARASRRVEHHGRVPCGRVSAAHARDHPRVLPALGRETLETVHQCGDLVQALDQALSDPLEIRRHQGQIWLA